VNGASSPQTIGFIQIVLAAFCFGIEPIFVNYFHDAGGNTWLYTFLRTGIAVMLIVSFCRPKDRHQAFRVDLRLPLLMAFFTVLIKYTQFEAVVLIPVAVAVTLYFLYPILIGLYAYVFRKDANPLIFGLLAMAFVGVILAVDPLNVEQNLNPLGVGLALVCAGLIAGYWVLSEFYMAKTGITGRVLSLQTYGLGFFMYGTFTFLTDSWEVQYTPDFLWPVAAGGLCGGAGSLFLLTGMKKLGAVKAGLIINAEILFTVGGSAFFLGQILDWNQYLGVALILSAILIEKTVSRYRQKEKPL